MDKSNNTEGKNCSTGGFDYCFWAKFIVGIPAVFIIIYVVSSLFTNPLLQMIFGALSGIAAIYVAIKIDKLPALSGKVFKPKD